MKYTDIRQKIIRQFTEI